MTGPVKNVVQVDVVEVLVALHGYDGPEGALHVEAVPVMKGVEVW